jgi:alkanesulfonate monooxygenase SsuD/methylene tetrahydromethanopterin reductase-like flavin-dependent oxidoreductase (luciferase family)
MAKLRWGVKTSPQHTTYDALLKVWQDADRTPAFEHAWLFDHFAPIQGDLDGPCFEGWTLLAALAAQTQRIRLRLMVAGNTYRHPAVHARRAHPASRRSVRDRPAALHTAPHRFRGALLPAEAGPL